MSRLFFSYLSLIFFCKPRQYTFIGVVVVLTVWSLGLTGEIGEFLKFQAETCPDRYLSSRTVTRKQGTLKEDNSPLIFSRGTSVPKNRKKFTK